MEYGKEYDHLNEETLFTVMENLYQELSVRDSSNRIAYMNRVSLRNYGLKPQEMIGHDRDEFAGEYYWPGNFQNVFESNRRLIQEEVTSTGRKIKFTSVPVFNDQGTVDCEVCVVEEPVEQAELEIYPDGEVKVFSQSQTPAISHAFDKAVAISPVMRDLITDLNTAAHSEIPILFMGESGTGKTMLAECVHKAGSRRDKPFFFINCAAIPEGLLESELFGYEPGSFTGACKKGKAGMVEAAEGGTLFLDEVGELSAAMQAKLLHLLESKTFRRIGGTETIQANARFICATNRDLETLVAEGTFRQDLYWRINGVTVRIPPLRERIEDIPCLAQSLLDGFNSTYQANHTLSDGAVAALSRYEWPGNVRELKNLMEQMAVIAPSDLIEEGDLPPKFHRAEAEETGEQFSFDEAMEHVKADIIHDASHRYSCVADMARALDISESSVRQLLHKFGSK